MKLNETQNFVLSNQTHGCKMDCEEFERTHSTDTKFAYNDWMYCRVKV